MSQINQEIEEGLNQIAKDDELSGHIYILKSKSEDEVIRNIQNLYKIGYASQSVKQRIKNAKNEATYLMADVEYITSYKVYNIDAKKLEKLLHQFFGNSCLNIKIVADDGEYHTPREWFIAPFEVIKQAIFMILNEEIVHYRYNETKQSIESK